jgi:voltage-gated potassium channel
MIDHFPFSFLKRLTVATVTRGLTPATHAAVATGIIAVLVVSFEPVYEAGHGWIEAVLWTCLGFFIWEWLVRMIHARRSQQLWAYLLSSRGVVDTIAALAIPAGLAGGLSIRSAWLLGVGWMLKGTPDMPGLRLLRRVLVQEAGPLSSVVIIFLIVLVVGSTVVHSIERDVQPEAFGSLPATMWWAVVTLTTTGYGDVVPITPLGRFVASLVMISGVGIFGLLTGILATGFAAENRRHNFIKTWESVSNVPFFTDLGPAAIADVTNILRRIDMPARTTVIRRGQRGDCMYFLASGSVTIELPGRNVRLEAGSFFGEMALLGNNVRSANVVTATPTTLLLLDLVDFRTLMARHPELGKTIDAEARRRRDENIAARET